MALIINIDTSSKFCSVAISIDGEIVFGLESSKEMDHSSSLAPFVDKAMHFLEERGKKPEAISVVYGPGSYTGLRIGLSLAKGLCYAMDIPLITLSSLSVMAITALFSYPEIEGDEIIVAMMDAGRMEVYSGIYDTSLTCLRDDAPEILNERSYEWLKQKRSVLFVGDGTTKFRDLYPHMNAKWIGTQMPHAKYMATLSELKFRKKKFAEIVLTTPRYLKEYKAVISKLKL